MHVPESRQAASTQLQKSGDGTVDLAHVGSEAADAREVTGTHIMHSVSAPSDGS